MLDPGSDPTRIEMLTDPTVQRMVGVAIHGNTPFDVPYISHITENLWVGGCETGFILPENIEHVVSLYPWEQYSIRHKIKSLMLYFMYDSEEQHFGAVDDIARWVVSCMEDGITLVHCQAGLNRSSLIAARALMLRGHSSDRAIDFLRSKRSPACLCNKPFEAYLRGLDQ